MKKPHWLLIAATVATSFCMASCDEQSEAGEYANWKNRNQEFLDSIAQVAQENSDEWRILKAYDLPQDDPNDVTAGKRDVNNYVYCQIEKEGTGKVSPIFTDSIHAHYRVWLINDKVIDNSYRGELNPEMSVPAKFAMGNGMINGWVTALQHMRVGDQWIVYMPYTLGYGTKGSGAVPGYSVLKYRINLAGVYTTGTVVPGWQ